MFNPLFSHRHHFFIFLFFRLCTTHLCELVNMDTPHQHEYNDEHTDTTDPSTEYYNEQANTSARYTTNTPPPARTQHPHEHEQIKRRTWHTTSTSPMSMMNTLTPPRHRVPQQRGQHQCRIHNQ